MNLFTPVLLLCMPLWVAASLLHKAPAAPSDPKPADRDDTDTCPTRWVGMPFTPPSVHAA